jgi:hypothetical protein
MDEGNMSIIEAIPGICILLAFLGVCVADRKAQKGSRQK